MCTFVLHIHSLYWDALKGGIAEGKGGLPSYILYVYS